ncbi:tenascin-N [Thalassophryne amazonica]|uniref:tenascin-N n=1 Tax=Thalassophryne amazonica TaxID=390379 RepID=UPI001471F4FB|nr:tenascin-N [Thalassophryne amazonica]
MTTELSWTTLRLLVLLFVAVCFSATDKHPNPSTQEQGVTFSHVYKIDINGSSGCNQERLTSQDESGVHAGKQSSANGENDIVFKHNIKLKMPKCDCEDSESFRSLLYRVNGLEEEVTYLKMHCAQGCCGQGAAGIDTSCSGRGTYQHEMCSCLCYPGWEGSDCSVSICPDDCNDNGRCVDGKCVCHQGYTGHNCSQQMCPDNCNDKGHCVDGKCICFQHFTGETCSVQKCPSGCSGNGRCVDGQCVCNKGFHGQDCSLVFSPQGLNLVEVTDITALVEWESVPGAEYYILKYHPKLNASALKQVQIPNTDNNYFITGLSPGVTYVVQAHTVIKELQSDAETIEAATDLSAVGGIRVLGQTEVSIKVDWMNPAAVVEHFKLTHTDPAGVEEEEQVMSSQEARTKHTIVGLNPGTEYLISVQAIQGSTEGKASSVTGATDIDAPRNLAAVNVTEDTATVSWDQVQAETEGYIVSYTSDEDSGTTILLESDRTSYKLTGLRPGVLYTADIWAIKGDRKSSKSSTVAQTELDAPNNVLAQDETESSFTVSWDHTQAEIEGYILTYSSSEGSSEEIPVGPDITSYRLTGLRPGTLYSVYIWAIKGDKVSRKISTQAETELDAPANLMAEDETESSFKVSWDRVQAAVDGYILTHTSSEGSSEEIPVGPQNTSYRLTGLKPGTRYSVSGWAIKGNKTSKKISTEADTELDAPTNLLTQDETESGFSVSWDHVQSEIDGYILAYTSAEGSSEEIPLGPDNTSYSLSSLRPGVLYNVYIWAIKDDKDSKKTSTQAETEIDAPKELKASDVTPESASLSWLPSVAEIDGYILSYRDEDGNTEMVEQQLTARERHFAASGLDMAKNYIVSLVAYRGNKKSKVIETTFKTVGLLYPFPMDCVQLMKNGNKKSGIYTIYVNNNRSRPMEVYCDMDTDEGGWLVLQRRNTGKLDFMKRWRQYVAGFGNMTEEFWHGLDKIYDLTNTPIQYELRFDLGLGSERVYAVYDDFKVAPAKQKFKLTVGKYSGTAGDAMTYHQGRPWTTVDSDNDIALGNCALTHRGAWWYKNCHLANLNGKWGDNRHSMGLNWEPWKGHKKSLDFTEMKIRPVGALSSRKRRSLAVKEKSRTRNIQK